MTEENQNEQGSNEAYEKGDPAAERTADVAPDLTPMERLALVEQKLDAIGHGLHALATHSKGHLLDAFIADWEKFTKGNGLGDANGNG